MGAPRLVYISDLHLRSAEDPLYRKLLALLASLEPAGRSAVVVLGGDVFDLFVGPMRVFLERYAEFLALIKRLARAGVEVHYIEGNHDFLLKAVYADTPAIRVHPREHALSVGERKFYVAHGDLVDRRDWGYRLLRVFFRSPVIRFMVRYCPDSWIEKLGAFSAERSKGREARTPTGLPAEKIEGLRRLYRSFASEKIGAGFDFVVLGHCHDLDQMRFKVGERGGHYMNAGFPPLHGSYIAWDGSSAELERRPF
jgi:UDP-2,3-diacylglucosamine hydrolase